ncbi:hypothetical protein Sgly_2348 [Syntrophobotulus glycolicus DSM 8271]|uniref:DUF4878 domain-containing protein n=1 Tax=Syntrophobotulus glycolicus (strain DSM 8271 / FlGlyR) TaxID=645991 RepID=F0SUS0_SYNGF|nr:DUF4878 domain-containing protein [Syntrophobotulus glycolicus]ADY56636.1 hypothetical protein Sgly_2348 [Syntrophobotulus glycolicus DSM 8271]
MKKLLFVAIAFIIIVGGVLAFSGQEIILNYCGVRNFFNEVEKGNFEKAFKFVDYYDAGDDVKPETSYEEAKEIWLSRMTKLKQDHIYLQEYKDLTVYVDDGYPKGEVTLFISDHGRIEEQKCSIHFSKLTDKWKIEDLYFTDSNHVFEKAISGNVKIE